MENSSFLESTIMAIPTNSALRINKWQPPCSLN